MYTITFKDELGPALAQLEAALADKTELMQDLGELLVQSTQDRMEAGENPDGSPFAPRSALTLAQYAEKGLSFGKPLNVTGELRLSIAYEASPDGVTWGSNAIQAAVMQLGAAQGAFGTNARGGPIPWGDIPAREYIGLSEEDVSNVILEIEEYLERKTAE